MPGPTLFDDILTADTESGSVVVHLCSGAFFKTNCSATEVLRLAQSLGPAEAASRLVIRHGKPVVLVRAVVDRVLGVMSRGVASSTTRARRLTGSHEVLAHTWLALEGRSLGGLPGCRSSSDASIKGGSAGMADEAGSSSSRRGAHLPTGFGEVYYFAGLRVGSSLPFAARVVEGPADVVVVRGEDRPVPNERPSEEVIAERVVDGSAWYTFAQCGEEVLGRFYGLVDFEIDRTGRRVTYYRDPADRDMVAILIAGSLVAYLLSSAGRLVLHASAVEVDGSAVAFVGFSGQGKTTVATLLCAEGYPLVTDDLLPVDPGPEGVTCAPVGIELRVREKVEALLQRFSSVKSAAAPSMTAMRWPLLDTRRTPAARHPSHPLARPGRNQRQRPPFAAGRSRTAPRPVPAHRGLDRSEPATAQFNSISAVVSSVPVLEMRVPWGPPFPTSLADEVVAVAREHSAVPRNIGVDV